MAVILVLQQRELEAGMKDNLPYISIHLLAVARFASALVFAAPFFSRASAGSRLDGLASDAAPNSLRHGPFMIAVTCLLGAFGVFLGTRLLWWIKDWQSLSLLGVSAAALIGGTSFWILTAKRFRHQGAKAKQASFINPAIFAFSLIAASLLLLTSGWMLDGRLLFSTWHHWVAYLGPAELMRGGARIFHDFAAQYGFGPTFVFSFTCGLRCAVSVYWVIIAFSIMFVGCLLSMVMIASRGASWQTRSVVLAAMVLASTLWVSFPPLVMSAVNGPSTGGMRFLPAVLLCFVLIANEVFARGAGWYWKSMPAFAICVLWSPEAFVQGLMIWGPYCCARSLESLIDKRLPRRLSAGLGTVGATFAAVAGGGLLAYRLNYGIWPRGDIFTAYLMHPPGPLPVDWLGPVWFVLWTLALGAAAAIGRIRAGDISGFRQISLACLLLCAAMTYTLGRSHSNNFLNILPYVTLVLVFCVTPAAAWSVRAAAAGLVGCVVGMSALFGWASWGKAVEFGPGQLARIDFHNRIADAKLIEEATTLPMTKVTGILARIRETSPDPVMVLDQSWAFLPAEPWMALHGPGNYAFMPSKLRRRVILNAAMHFRRAGWVVVQKGSSPFWRDGLAFLTFTTHESVWTFNKMGCSEVLFIQHLAPQAKIQSVWATFLQFADWLANAVLFGRNASIQQEQFAIFCKDKSETGNGFNSKLWSKGSEICKQACAHANQGSVPSDVSIRIGIQGALHLAGAVASLG
jgi:hypothetical protein